MKKNNVDKENMKEVIAESPDQLIKGLDLARPIKVEGSFKNVIVRGIGGSALPVDILNSLVLPSVPVCIYRGYGLPKIADKNSLIICISYSGNTEEPISGLKEAINRNLKTIVIASGGEAEKISRQNNLPFAKIPSGIQPRSATGYLFSALSTILTNCGIISDISNDILQTAQDLKKINPALEKEGKNLAKKLAKKIPIIYASNNFEATARIWKIKLNENSKIPAFHNYFPELNHNEMVGFSQTKEGNNFHVLIIKDKDDHPRIIKRMKLTASILNKKGVKVDFVETKEGSLMFRVFSNLLLGDWTSYYLALNYKVDPTPVAMVEEFKKMMQK
ncbi:MAG: bifunctional phosphoglucose/phosphomannose isomerase [Candidatus Staskawiczbacteria bacterium]|jgi:glucose/mannose-6-phosphate isomerase